MKSTNIFKGHIVHCLDLDSRDEFNVEVLINERLEEDAMIKAAEASASKLNQVTLSGNTFEFEYIQPSGRIVEKVITRTELSPIDPESKTLLDQRTID